MLWSSILIIASLSLVGASPTPTIPYGTRWLAKRQNSNPAVPGNSVQGWQELPTPADADLFRNFSVAGGEMPLYQSSNRTKSNIKRAVIILPGKLRDCWYYFNTVNNGLIQAADEYDDVTEESISIMGPCFLTEEDLEAGAASAGQFLWGDTTWASGHYNEAGKPTKTSAYDVMDGLVDHYMDRTAYPNLEAVVVGGHSLGAQMAQRYLGLRKPTVNDDRLQWWIANSGSFMWLVTDRPHNDSTCDGIDDFKYGLDGNFPGYSTGDAADLGRAGLQERYRGRVAHYAQGLDDDGNGDTRCQAMTQGSTHLERGQNFEQMLKNMTGGEPTLTTFDYIEGVSHFNEGMVYSAQGKDKLFRYLPPQAASDLVKNSISGVQNLVSKIAPDRS